jgi:hypothetical protein
VALPFGQCVKYSRTSSPARIYCNDHEQDIISILATEDKIELVPLLTNITELSTGKLKAYLLH